MQPQECYFLPSPSPSNPDPVPNKMPWGKRSAGTHFFLCRFFPLSFKTAVRKWEPQSAKQVEEGNAGELGSKVAPYSVAKLQKRQGSWQQRTSCRVFRKGKAAGTVRTSKSHASRAPRQHSKVATSLRWLQMGWTLRVFLGKGTVAESVYRNVNELSHLCCMHKSKKKKKLVSYCFK